MTLGDKFCVDCSWPHQVFRVEDSAFVMIIYIIKDLACKLVLRFELLCFLLQNLSSEVRQCLILEKK